MNKWFRRWLMIVMSVLLIFSVVPGAYAADQGGNNGGGKNPRPVKEITVAAANAATTITKKGGSLQMSASVKPANADDKSVTWSVVNTDNTATDKASISKNGHLTAIKNGQVKVVATANDGSNVQGTAVITISGQVMIKVTKVTVTGAGNVSTITTKGGTLQMTASVAPANADDKSVTWSVVNTDNTATDIATISTDGLLTAIKNGQVKVEATANDGSKISGSAVITISSQETDDWTLVWSDEFDGTGANPSASGLDLDKWGYQLGTGSQYGLDGWGNNEQQYYREENVSVRDGKLVIEAKNESHGGKPYTSGRIFTEPTFTKAYGKFEAKIKLPIGEGIWPAFWMMPATSEYGGWAASGEIDIMEAKGRLPNKVGGAIHYGGSWPNNIFTSADYNFPEGETISEEHIYSLEWEPGELRWYVDGNLYQKLNNWSSKGNDQATKYSFPAPFDQPYYMIMNLAVGGNFDGNRLPNDSDLPAKMEVDYVRVYELTGRPYKTPVEPIIAKEPLPAEYKMPVNGNYVYDAAYEQGFTDIATPDQALDTNYWNFAHINTFNGNGSISTQTIEGKTFAKVDITNGGNAVHSVQLIQNVTLGKGRWYTLTFDAKAAANRNMTVKFGGGESRGWSVYSDAWAVPLTTEVKSYEYAFQMAANTDVLARLEFNMGTNTNSVWIGNVKLVESAEPDPFGESKAKEPIAGNHVYNGTFDLGRIDRMTYWNFGVSGGADATGSVDANRQFIVAIQNEGAASDVIRLWQPGIQLLKSNDYQLTFKAKAEQARSIDIAVRKADGTTYMAAKSVNLTTSISTYTVNFTMNDPSDPMGQLEFWFGGNKAGVTLDDVKLVRLTNAGTNLTLAEQFPLKNGDFSNGQTNWSEHVQGRYDGWGSSANFTVKQGFMDIDIANVGVNAWDVMLMQTDFPLKQNYIFTVTLDAKSTENREAEIVVDSNNNRYVSEKVSLTSNWQTFSYELKPSGNLTASFKLLLGKIDAIALGAHTVSVDNVRIEIKDARSKAFLVKNGEFSDGMTNWSEHVQGRYDGWDKVSGATVVNGGAKINVANLGNNPWDVMMFQDGLNLVADQTYIVSFAARSTIARNIEAIVENGTYQRVLNQTVTLDEATKTYQFEFKAPRSEAVGVKFLVGKLANAPATVHDIFIDNVRFELKGAKDATGEKYTAAVDIMLPAGPVLNSDGENNAVGKAIVISYVDNPAWRNAINAVVVNGTVAATESYSIAASKLVLDASLFPAEGDYTVVVRAHGFEPAAVTQHIQEKMLWTLVWSDEFDSNGTNLDTNGLNLDKWAYQNGTGAEFGLDGWGNNEQQYYSKNNINVNNGVLTIEAKKQPQGGKPYTSGRLWTSPTFSQAFGKFEARIKLPVGQGLWPAFWMMPKNSEYGGWASSGEIDIMEARGRLPNEVGGTIHYSKGYPDNKATGATYVFPNYGTIEDFHTYGIEWEPGEFRWYVDGVLYQTVNEWDSWGAGQPEKYAYPAPFDKPFYMIMNLAVGGNFDGNKLPADSMLPAKMEVDYVRAYELTGRDYRTPVEPVLAKEPFPAGGKAAINGNYIYDTDYEQGLRDITSGGQLDPNYAYWNFLHTPDYGGAGSASIDTINGSKYSKIAITNGGNQSYSLQMIQHATIVKGHTYKVSFDAMASAPRSISVKVGGDDDNAWAAYSDNFSAALTTVVKNYEYRFTMKNTTDLTARLEFNLGLNTNTVWIGNVKIEETTSLFDPDAAKAPLDSGNHIYNGTFDLGTMDRMVFWNFTTKNANATASVDANRRQLDVAITDGGNNPGVIALAQQGLNLLQKDSYTLTFDAKAATNRTIDVRLLSKDSLTEYAAFNDVALASGGMAGLTFSFTMPAGVTDEHAQIVFELGGDNADVTIDNVKLIRTTNHNIDYSGIELYPLKNGDFFAGLTYWEPFTQGASASFAIENESAKVNVTAKGAEIWGIMLNQPGLKLAKGMTYEFKFDAKSSVSRDIVVTLENDGYTRRFDSGFVQLGTDMKSYTFAFKMPVDETVTLKIQLGNTPGSPAGAHSIWIDNVVLKVKDAPVLNPPTVIADTTNNKVGQSIGIKFASNADWSGKIAAVTLDGALLDPSKYIVDASQGLISFDASVFTSDKLYTIVIQADGYGDAVVKQQMLPGDGNLVLNGSFSSGSASWIYWVGEGGISEWTTDSGAADVTIHYHGGMHPQWGVPITWSTQLIQEGIKLVAGRSYELSFKASSTVNRPILIELGGYNNNQQAAFNLNGTSTTFFKSLTPTGNITLALKFLLGNVVNGDNVTPLGDHTITIDDVMIREVKPAPKLNADTTENKVGQPIEITFTDQQAWRDAVTAVLLDGVAVPGGNYTLTAGKLTLDASLFTAIRTYAIVVMATGYAPAEVSQDVLSAANNVALNKTATASSNKQPAKNAFDGNKGTRWESDSSDPQWIAVDLGSVHDLEMITLNWEGAYGKNYEIQVSKAEAPGQNDWTTVYTETAGKAGIKSITLNNVEARHVRMYGMARGTIYGYSLWEFEVYGTSQGGGSDGDGGGGTLPQPTVNLALNKTVTVSSGTNPNAITDGNMQSRWEARWQDNQGTPMNPEWTVIDLGSTVTISKLILFWEGAYGKKVEIQIVQAGQDTSAGSSDWQTIKLLDRTLTTGVGGSALEEVELTKAEQARYVRLYVTEKGLPPYGPSLYEIEIY